MSGVHRLKHVERFGTANLKGETRRLKLASGDVLMFGGPARLMYHGIDRILPGTSSPAFATRAR